VKGKRTSYIALKIQRITRYCAGCDVGCGCSRAGMNCVEPISTEVIKYQKECQTYIQAQKGS
jgi:hypothetical protein